MPNQIKQRCSNQKLKTILSHQNIIFLSICGLIITLLVWLAIKIRVLHIDPTANNRQKLKLEDIEFKTGDLLLFQTRSSMTFHTIGLFTQMPFTHVGIVYIDPRNLQKYVWEVESNGPALNALTPKLKRFKGRIFYRSINIAVNPYLLESVIRKYINVSYNSDLWIDFYHRAAPYLSWTPNVYEYAPKRQEQNDKSTIASGNKNKSITKNKKLHKLMTCSLIVLTTYHEVGVMDINSINLCHRGAIAPGDFSSDSNTVYCLKPFEFSKEIELQI